MAVILLFLFYSAGTLLLPVSNFTPGVNLHEMYEQCSIEDHDITPLDFVFEHILNFEVIINFFEGEHEYVNGDHPHEPYQSFQPVSLFSFAITNAISFEFKGRQPFPAAKKAYFLGKIDIYLSNFNPDILRPPIALI